MKNPVHTVRSWDGVYYVPRLTGEQIRDTARFAAGCALILAFLYCAVVGWGVIQELREVRLLELRQVLRRVSVGDALLTWLGYVFVRDVLRALVARRPPV